MLVVVPEMHGHIAATAIPHHAIIESGMIVVAVYVGMPVFHKGKFRENIPAVGNMSRYFRRLSRKTFLFVKYRPLFMQKIALFFCLTGLLITQTSCAAWKQNRWLSNHNQTLKRLAESKLPPEQKLDGMVQDYVQFMNEDLKFLNPVKGVKFVQKYHTQNEQYIDKILNESQKWQGGLNTLEKVELGVRVAKKPYIKDVVDLVPKFKKKYKQYAFIVSLTGKVVGGLTGFLGKGLGI